MAQSMPWWQLLGLHLSGLLHNPGAMARSWRAVAYAAKGLRTHPGAGANGWAMPVKTPRCHLFQSTSLVLFLCANQHRMGILLSASERFDASQHRTVCVGYSAQSG